jgi:hypothetical protein
LIEAADGFFSRTEEFARNDACGGLTLLIAFCISIMYLFPHKFEGHLRAMRKKMKNANRND